MPGALGVGLPRQPGVQT